nr:hypothetical protein [Tanacetum cinerariifolium]
MRRVGKGCSGVETPLFEGMLIAKELEEQGDVEEQSNANNAAEDPVTAVSEDDRVDTSDDTIMEDVSNQGRMIDELDKDEGVVLINEKEETEEVKDITGDAQVEGRQADIYRIDMDYAAKVLSMQEDEPKIQEEVEVVTTAKLITEVVDAVSETVSAATVVPIVTAAVVPTITATPIKVVVPSTRRRRGVVIMDPQEESSSNTPIETIRPRVLGSLTLSIISQSFDEELEAPMEDQPLPTDASHTTLLPGYIDDSNKEKDEEDPEEDPIDYPASVVPIDDPVPSI